MAGALGNIEIPKLAGAQVIHPSMDPHILAHGCSFGPRLDNRVELGKVLNLYLDVLFNNNCEGILVGGREPKPMGQPGERLEPTVEGVVGCVCTNGCDGVVGERRCRASGSEACRRTPTFGVADDRN